MALLQDLDQKLGLTVVLITHGNLGVKGIANRVAVMQDGRLIGERAVSLKSSQILNMLTQDFISTATGIDESHGQIETRNRRTFI